MRFQVLGVVGAWAGDTCVEVRGSKMRTFLAALLLANGRVVSDARLMQMLWDEDLPTTTQAQIQTYASRLRSLLGAEARIRRHPPGYGLELLDRSRVHIDLVEFESLAGQGNLALAAGRYAEASTLLRRALSEWDGPALGGVTEHLAVVEQPRLEEARLTVLERCIDAEMAMGEHRSLITELTALVASEPFRERPRSQLITALHRGGRTADALQVYQDFRATLAEGLGIDPSADLQELHRSVLTAVPLESAPQPPVRLRRRRAEPATGAVLPLEPSDFTGREHEAATARAVLTPAPEHDGPPGVCVVSGMDGAGKTTLALRVARLLRTEFPDQQLLVDLGARHPEPLSPATALSTLLSRLRVPEAEQPESFAAKVELYCRTLSGSRTLIVLDDAHDERQVRPLLPAVPGCGALITSRSPLAALEGATRVTLDAFSFAESLRLLTTITGPERVERDPGSTAQIIERCDYLPIAIRACGARLTTRAHWPLRRLADRLAEPDRVLDEMRTGDLDVRERLLPSYTALCDAQREALHQLVGLGSFSVDTAADLFALPVVDTVDLLDGLIEAHVLRPGTEADNRYRLPKLIHALAVEHDEHLLRAVG